MLMGCHSTHVEAWTVLPPTKQSFSAIRLDMMANTHIYIRIPELLFLFPSIKQDHQQ